MTRFLIVNADDFGLSDGVNQGVIRAYEEGLVTSASLMTGGAAAEDAAAYARLNPELSVGLHLDFGEWLFRDGDWHQTRQVVPLPNDRAASASEAARQIDRFLQIVGRPPTHLDSHQHAHRDEPLRSVVLEAAQRWGIPVRHAHPEVRYCGRFYGQTSRGEPFPQAITAENLVGILNGLPEGWTELACHPGLGNDAPAVYRTERADEVAALCAPSVRSSLAETGIALRSFHDVRECLRMDR
ncbi:carbohydrate deacetylase [Singulisphaera acidiphila]|uniref:ChbG/HpnK family deacetylase n=1 Tax=Singulisphaera acidiphila (strain ATCC BAA-1392 / DSM 18658 / VKM B-2454 / MOB10) TaxID=886293 RepID=L0DIW2_SINAD|nr:ChbG/HpnK family deacetylase [Singulisphaera acidiphila]AGA28596.1 hypothetical protein Sinac_4405 [Singulisphaera acidiphila DSM 18658]